MRYVKRPAEIDAIRWTGQNYREIKLFIDDTFAISETVNSEILIYTLEGIMTASVGSYIIKGVEGEIYPCDPDIFAKTYDPVIKPKRK